MPTPAAESMGLGSSPKAASRRYSEMWLEVRVNGTDMSRPAHMLRLNSGELLASAEDLARWRVRSPLAAPITIKGSDYFPLDGVDGLRYEIDERTQILILDGPARIFLPTIVKSRAARYSPPDPASFGAFLNYDLQLATQSGARRLDGLLELGMFNRWGYGTSTFLGHGLDVPTRFVRLDTAWTQDDPAAVRSLRLGDSISRTGTWWRSVRYGGVQWGTDFATRPEIVPFPLPTVSGEALQPSTLDLYVDNALRLTQKVPYGPFSIPNVPVITGEGQVAVVVRDSLGREQIISQPYYVSNTLIQRGMHDYTYEAGFVRRNYALESDAYGRFFAAGTHRYGFSDELTGEARAELMATQQTLGAGATWLAPNLGTVSGALALSHGVAGTGGLILIGAEHQARRFSAAWQSQVASAGFAQLGLAEGHAPPRQTSVGRVTYSLRGGGSLFASYTNQATRTQPGVEFVSAGYSTGIAENMYLSLFALRSISGEPIRSLGISLTCSLGPRTSASLDWNRQGDESTPTLQIQQSLPQGSGYGYRLTAAGGAHPRSDVSLFAQNDVGTYGLEVARAGNMTAERISAAGGISVLGGELHLSRRLDDSFAVVKVGEYPGVPVYLDNQQVALTDRNGSAVLPSLRPYQANNITIQQDALPLDARVGTLRMSVTLSRRSAKLVEFPVRASRGALLRLVLDDGSPVPSGAVVTVKGQSEEFPVALRGEAYVTDLEADNELRVRWKGAACTIGLRMPKGGGPMPTLGPLVCHGVRP